MITRLDSFLNRITMYRLVLSVPIGLIGIGVLFAFFRLLPFPPFALLASSLFLVIMCWAMNTIFASVLKVPTNVESACITALILALIIDPAQSPIDFQFLGWGAILAMTSKYVLALYKKHLFNPAAIAVVMTSYVLGKSASWWIGTASMVPALLIGGWLVARKIRQEDMVLIFCATAFVGVSIVTFVQGGMVFLQLEHLLIQSPLFFFACIMLTEPLTAPPTKKLRRIYAVLTGMLFLPQIHVGPVYSTPELALVIGNSFAYLVSPKRKDVLKLIKKIKMAPDIIKFVFKHTHKLSFVPGQYMEFTLVHPHPDSRGNRRYFTLASSPTENAVHMGIRFYGQGSSFKKALSRIDGRTQLIGAQLAGDFTLHPDPKQKLFFIAGGIGITPFRSMLKYLLDTQEKRDIVLFYANKTPDQIVYQDVLSAAQAKLGIKTFYTLTDTVAAPKNWSGFLGRINEEMIQKVVPDYEERTYYVSGPLHMVNAYEQILKNMRIKQKQIKKDFFPGLV